MKKILLLLLLLFLISCEKPTIVEQQQETINTDTEIIKKDTTDVGNKCGCDTNTNKNE
jgi:hypothetical protein